MGHRIAVLGASGYAGGELVRILDRHPALDLVYLAGYSSEGSSLAEVHPQLEGGARRLGPIDPGAVPEVDLAFLALPHGASAIPGAALAERGVKVVDLGSDYRLDSPQRYREAYGAEHPHPEQLGSWVYGLPELFGEAVRGASAVAAPGCYPTAAVLALAPLVAAGVVEPGGIVVDAISGVTGAGRSPRPELTFGAIAEGVRAYGVITHRHRPEMEQAISTYTGTEAAVLFTPHLAPMQRGLLATSYAHVADGAGEADLRAALADTYRDAPFVRLLAEPPQTRWTANSNTCLISAHVDGRTGTAVVLSALDNLGKGAAGQAVQCANLMLGLEETAGLSGAGWLP